MAAVDSFAAGKKAAAWACVDENCTRDMVLGIGSGSTIVFAVERLAEIARSKKLVFTCALRFKPLSP